MQILERRVSFGDAILLFIIASLSFLFIPAWIPVLRKGWQLLIVATIIILLSKRGYIYRKAMPALILYGVILCLNALIGDALVGTVSNAINEILMLFVVSSLAIFCTHHENRRFIKTLIWITFIALIIEMIASYITLQVYPGIIRGLHAIVLEENDISVLYEFYRLGILDYSMAHAIPIIVPPLICHFKEEKSKKKLLYGLLVAVCIFLVWQSESSTALILVLLMLFLGLLVDVKSSPIKQMRIISVGLFLSIILLSNDYITNSIFGFAGRIVGEESIYAEKIEELQSSIIDDQTTGDLEGRLDKYEKSIKLFLNNPIFGVNKMPGRHSSLLDILATLGLIGFVPLIVFFYRYLKLILNILPAKRRIYYLESCMAAFLMVLFKGMWVWPIFLFLFTVTPGLLSTSLSKGN